MPSPVDERMRKDWNERGRTDAYYFVATSRRHQAKAEFLATGAPMAAVIESRLARIRTAGPPGSRRALEIGCGPGRLMLPVSQWFAETHGIDVSDEMIALARDHLRDVPGIYLYHGSGSDLSPLASENFDLVYSYAVFQHIPDAAVVTGYIAESVRVLKPGGLLCCQLRGAPAPAASTGGQSETWVGCVYPLSDVLALARRLGMHVVEVTGIDTQFMWLVARKPLSPVPEAISSNAVLKAITPADNPYGIVSPTGPGAAFQCWLEGFPEFTSLGDLEVTVGSLPATPCYLSDHLGRGGFQLNILVPRETQCGDNPVRLYWHGRPIGPEHTINIREYPPLKPTIEEITDGVDLACKYSTSTGTLKVAIAGIADPGRLSFSIDSTAIDVAAPSLRDAYRLVHEFQLCLPDGLLSGPHLLTVRSPEWTETVEVRCEPS